MNDRLFLQTRIAWCAALLLLAIPGCLSNSDDDRRFIEPPIERGIDQTIRYLEQVWHYQLYAEYDAILHDQFEFFPLERDVQDFPWMTSPSWGRAEELNIAVHIFDPNFSGQQNPVDAIEIELTELSRRDLGDNHVEVTCAQQGRVLTSADDGWSFDTRVLLEFVPDPDEPGLWQLIKETELDAV